MKSKRISIPVPLEIERAARSISAKNGRSLSSVLCDFLLQGKQKIDIAESIAALKNHLASSANGVASNDQALEKNAAQIAEIRSFSSDKSATGATEKCLAIPADAAEKLFEAAYFASAVIVELGAADLPGAARQPFQHYLRIAREKSRAQLQSHKSLLPTRSM